MVLFSLAFFSYQVKYVLFFKLTLFKVVDTCTLVLHAIFSVSLSTDPVTEKINKCNTYILLNNIKTIELSYYLTS